MVAAENGNTDVALAETRNDSGGFGADGIGEPEHSDEVSLESIPLKDRLQYVSQSRSEQESGEAGVSLVSWDTAESQSLSFEFLGIDLKFPPTQEG